MSDHQKVRRDLFRFVRDIPYHIGLSLDEQDYCCATKVPMLQKLLLSEGILSRRIWCRFLWKATPFPSEIIDLAANEENGHEYLEVFVPESEQWVTVDPTWDVGLAEAKFEIADWDGASATSLAIAPIKTFSPEETSEMIKRMNALSRSSWEKFYAEQKEFFSAINGWLYQQRRRIVN